MRSSTNDLPSPGSTVLVRVAGRPEVSEGRVEDVSKEGVMLSVNRPPDLGVMTLLEFLGPDNVVTHRRTACMVFRRGSLNSSKDTSAIALEFVDLIGGPTLEKDGLLQRFTRFFGRRSSTVLVEDAELSLPPREGPTIGIDLGTANCCVAANVDGRVQVLLEGEHRTIPSVVYFGPNGRRRVGRLAQDKRILEPTRTIFGSKRFLGRPFISEEVRRWGHFFPYQLVQGVGGTTAVKIGHELYPLEEVAKEILVVLKNHAEYVLRCPVHRAIISVPAYFGEPQRAAVLDAGRRAGLRAEKLVNEPTAAAIAYGYGRGFRKAILVYDLGGGTFDVSILRINGAEVSVLATGGDPFLGGADFDDRLTEHILYKFEKLNGTSLRDDYVAVQRIRFAAEIAKIELTEREVTEVLIPNIQQQAPNELRVKVTRQEFQNIVGDLIDRTLVITDAVLKEAGLKAQDIQDFVLVGGQTRTPLVRQRLTERFGQSPSRQVNADEAVAVGAALLGESLNNDKKVALKDILSASIQWNVAQDSCEVLLRRGTRLPAEAVFEIPEQMANDDEGYRLQLYRGEASSCRDNSFIGALNFDEAYLGGKARVLVSAEGLLSIKIARSHASSGDWQSTTVDFVEAESSIDLG
ncbi:MAG: Hsp70 family protein [Myxococcales bacterium]|nr:Hsp70 family protein [Myxococcales bacterium]